MSANTQMRAMNASPLAMPGEIWAFLRAEREDVCKALLAIPLPTEKAVNGWHQSGELFQARLSKIDDALDRLTEGNYGRCRGCGGYVEQKRLAADPAASLCLACQTGIETKHPKRSL